MAAGPAQGDHAGADRPTRQESLFPAPAKRDPEAGQRGQQPESGERKAGDKSDSPGAKDASSAGS